MHRDAGPLEASFRRWSWIPSKPSATGVGACRIHSCVWDAPLLLQDLSPSERRKLCEFRHELSLADAEAWWGGRRFVWDSEVMVVSGNGWAWTGASKTSGDSLWRKLPIWTPPRGADGNRPRVCRGKMMSKFPQVLQPTTPPPRPSSTCRRMWESTRLTWLTTMTRRWTPKETEEEEPADLADHDADELERQAQVLMTQASRKRAQVEQGRGVHENWVARTTSTAHCKSQGKDALQCL